MVYKGSNETYDFRKLKTIHVFRNEIRNNIINMSMANDEQNQNQLQRLSIALAQVKAANNSESLLNEIRQIVYSLYQSEKMLKKYITT